MIISKETLRKIIREEYIRFLNKKMDLEENKNRTQKKNK